MKAWTINKYGGPEVLSFTDIDKPKIAKGKIVVEVHYAALNPYDYKLRNGIAKMMTGKKFPKVFGGDFAGVIVETNESTGNYPVGQKVYGFANIFMREQGSLAEYTAISTKYVRPLPPGIELIDACAMPSAGLTALNGILKCGELKDKKILVNGATGGVGHLATQIFVARGGDVTAVCSTKNIPVAEKLGVDRVIDYSKESALDRKTSYDIIYDAAATMNYSEAKKYLIKSGIYCTTEEGMNSALQLIRGKFNWSTSMALSSFRGKPEEFIEMEDLMTTHGVKPLIYQSFPFAEVDKAFETLENGRFYGKILVNVKES
ncbi:MAG: NAD(P)-dependent alcohol dehydrogenase [FCB group bacterium]|nr:NAD(P)-dependent alcohol dehydrogenase [FCB group bacterium]